MAVPGCGASFSTPASMGSRSSTDSTWPAMRLRHLTQVAGGLSFEGPERAAAKAVIVEEVERLRWRLWNGRAKDAKVSVDRIRAVLHHSHGHVRGQGSGLGVHGSSPAVGSDPRSEPVPMTRWCAAPDQTHIRSPLVAAAPTSRIRRVGLRKPGPFFRSAVEANDRFGPATWIRQD